MKRDNRLWQLFGFSVTSLGGTLLHFLYDWLAGAIWIAPFSGVNESTWEHMKLLFWPMLIFAFVQSFFYRDREDYVCVKLRGILLGLLLIPTIFYAYNGIIGKSPDWLNITIFFISAAAAYVYEYKLFNGEVLNCRSKKAAVAVLMVIALLFVIFTFYPPRINLFLDPLTNTYGISK